LYKNIDDTNIDLGLLKPPPARTRAAKALVDPLHTDMWRHVAAYSLRENPSIFSEINLWYSLTTLNRTILSSFLSLLHAAATTPTCPLNGSALASTVADPASTLPNLASLILFSYLKHLLASSLLEHGEPREIHGV
jgi:hypothetical protein